MAGYTKALSKLSQKVREKELNKSMEMVLKGMTALSVGNGEGFQNYAQWKVWGGMKPTQGFVHYLQGLAAMSLGEQKQAHYHFTFVQTECQALALATYAKGYLEKISQE